MLNLWFLVDEVKWMIQIRLCLKSEPIFDKILQNNPKFFVEYVEIGGIESGVLFEDDQLWTSALVDGFKLLLQKRFEFPNQTKEEKRFEQQS